MKPSRQTVKTISKILGAFLALTGALSGIALIIADVNDPANARPAPGPGVIVHKEYVPASTRLKESCSGAVPMMCSKKEVLQRQCWRLDLEITHRYSPRQTERMRKVGDPDHWIAKESHCVFPSEFKKLKVGDTFVEDAVVY